MQLQPYHYDALDNSSSFRLSEELRFIRKYGLHCGELYTSDGRLVAVPTWAILCCLAERQEEEAESAG